MKNFNGKVLFLDRSDINTDEIIPAKYLTEISKQALKPFLLEDLSLAGFTPNRDIDDKQVIVTRANFGCGSSREHAPAIIKLVGVGAVLGKSFARIFFRNAINVGLRQFNCHHAAVEHVLLKNSGKAGSDDDIDVIHLKGPRGVLP